MRKIMTLLGVLFFVSACADATRDLAEPVEPLGNFKLGFSEVVAPNLQKLLISRDATEEEWIAAVDTAVETRFNRFDGSAFFHFGISVEAYSLPPPVVPGKSALAMRVTIWEDATGEKLNPETEVISVIKVFESRLTMTREDQIRILAEDAAKELETWLREKQTEAGWFGEYTPGPDAVDAAEAPATPGDVTVEPLEDAG